MALRTFGVTMVAAAQVAVAMAQGAPAQHDRAFWVSIVNARYAVPAGASPAALAQELSGLLGSPDPELRDTIAYSILAVWIAQRPALTDPQVLPLLEAWQANLQSGLGESGSDAVLKRSFSALSLATLAERDLATPFLGPARYRALLDAALAYLAAERDLRGYDAEKGWMHATAHTADLLKALAGNPLFTKDDQRRVLTAVAGRLASAGQVFTQGEQDRLAQAAAAIARRPDFDAATFDAWIVQLRGTIRQAVRTAPLTPAALATAQNGIYFLQALYARLSMETLDGPAAASRAGVLTALRPR
jgi:hypothetical protein